MKNSDESEDVVYQTFNYFLKQGGNSCWVGMKKCNQDLLIFKISLRVLVLLVESLFLRSGSFKQPTRRDLARAVTHMGGPKTGGHDPFCLFSLKGHVQLMQRLK